MTIELLPYDPADYLIDEETIAGYLSAALESNDPRVVTKALGAVARARGGIDKLARVTGISPDVLSRELGAGEDAQFGIVLKVIDAFGLRLSANMVA
jgi:probable addiction module antidote protein